MATRGPGVEVTSDIVPLATLTVCPYCKQALLNNAAIEALRKSEADYNRKLAETAAAEAARIAASEIAAKEQLWRRKEQQWSEKLNALREQKRKDEAKLKVEIEQGADEKAQRKVAAKLRSLQQTLQTTVAEKESLQRRLEQLTAAERGAFGEEDLVRELKQHFPDDTITRRGKGGDVLHEILYRSGGERVRAGLIVYEAKDTLHWNKAFVDEVKEAAELHRTPYAVVVTKAFPPKEKGELFVRDDVIVVKPSRVVDLISVLRRMVIEVHRAGLTAQGQAEKTMALYRYLTSEAFRQTFDAIGGVGEQLKGHLADERKAHQRTWERREGLYNELAEKTAAVDERIKSIIERPASSKKAKVIDIPAS